MRRPRLPTIHIRAVLPLIPLLAQLVCVGLIVAGVAVLLGAGAALIFAGVLGVVAIERQQVGAARARLGPGQ